MKMTMKHPRESSSLWWLSWLWCIRSSAVYYWYCGAALTSSFKIQYLMWCDVVMLWWFDVMCQRDGQMKWFNLKLLTEIVCCWLTDWLTTVWLIELLSFVCCIFLFVVSSYLLTCLWWWWWYVILMEDCCCLMYQFQFQFNVARCTAHPASRILHRIEGWLLAGFWTLLVLFFTGHKISHPDSGWYCTVVQEVQYCLSVLYCRL